MNMVHNPFTHLGKNMMTPFYFCMDHVHFDWFYRYVCIGEHFWSDLNIFIFRFDFMFVKPRNAPPNWYKILLQQFLYPEGRRCKKFGVRSCCNKNLVSVCTLKQNIGGISRGFTNIKSNQNISISNWKCSPVHTYRLNQSKWTISKQISERGVLCFIPRWANGLPSVRKPRCRVPIVF